MSCLEMATNNRSAKAGRKSVDGRSRDLLSKEEEYKRLNEELEKRTASLVREAERVMKDQESYLSKPSLLDNINTDDFLDDWEDSQPDNIEKPASRMSKVSNPSRAAKKRANNRPGSKADNVAVPSSGRQQINTPDEAFLTDYKDFSLTNAISNIEDKFDDDSVGAMDDSDDVVPAVANEMGSEAQIRFLKAKLRVMQEELDKLAEECNKKEESNNTFKSRLKEAEDERGRLLRTNSSQQTQIDKFKRIAEDAKSKCDGLGNQLVALRKELDTLKRGQKKQATDQSATEVRLNRALEEVEKYKLQLHRAKSTSKDTVDSEKKRVDQLTAENKRLEKQKNELLTGFKKQLKLIDILKRQKMHIEAAKMLAFTEEEFVKALEWGN